METPDAYAAYQSAVWDACLETARRALGKGAPDRDVRRAAARTFVRRCLAYRTWTARRAQGSEAWLGRTAPAAEA